MIKIGVTGGMGSGKSVVCDIFRLFGIPVFDADKEAKHLNNKSVIVREKLIQNFGSEIYVGEKLNKKMFAALIFNDDKNLKIANSIIHPEVANSFVEWCLQQKNSPVAVIEAALLIEAGFNKYVDKIITVYSSKEARIERIIKRDTLVRSEVVARMNSQMPEEEKIKIADLVIYNDYSQPLIKQACDILNELVPHFSNTNNNISKR